MVIPPWKTPQLKEITKQKAQDYHDIHVHEDCI